MFKYLVLILFVMSSFAFTQTNDNSSSDETSNATIFDEFEKLTNGGYRTRMDSFLVELQDNPSAQGYLINYGTNKDISAREKLLRNHLSFRKFDPVRIVFVRGGFRGEVKTELWIVPYGAELPTVKAELKQFDEFGPVANGYIKALLDSLFVELQDQPDKKGYIVTTGAARQILSREKLMRNYILVRKFDSSRIKLVNNGFSDEIKTEFWIDL